MGDTKNSVTCSLLSRSSHPPLTRTLRAAQSKKVPPDLHPRHLLSLRFKRIVSKMELAHKEARLVTRACRMVPREYLRERQEG